MRVLGVVPGLPGLFVSAVFSAALSSLSTLLNSLAAVILEDFVKPRMGKAMQERHVALTMRLVVVTFGVSSIFMVYVVEKLGMVLQLSATLQSSLYGPMLGIFTVGMLMPWVGEKVRPINASPKAKLKSVFFSVIPERFYWKRNILLHHGLDCGECPNCKHNRHLPAHKTARFR